MALYPVPKSNHPCQLCLEDICTAVMKQAVELVPGCG